MAEAAAFSADDTRIRVERQCSGWEKGNWWGVWRVELNEGEQGHYE